MTMAAEVLLDVVEKAQQLDDDVNSQLKATYWYNHWKKPDLMEDYRRVCTDPAPSFFQVERVPGDEAFVQTINETDALIYRCRRSLMEPHINDQLAHITSMELERAQILGYIPKEDLDFYHRLIQAYATWVYYLYPTEYFLRSACINSLHHQLDCLWAQYSDLNQKQGNAAIVDFCNYVTLHKIDTKKYPIVNEIDFTTLLDNYNYKCSSGLRTASYFSHHKIRPVPGTAPLENAMFSEIKEVTDKMIFCSKWKLDEYATFLDAFFLKNAWGRLDELYDHVLKTFNLKLLPKWCLDDPSYKEPSIRARRLEKFFHAITCEWRHMILDQLSKVLLPILELGDPVSVFTCDAVNELILLAEIRRMALGSQFLSKNHFLWAFYKSGYGLPAGIRDKVDLNINNEDHHPPYHIYMAAINLANSLGRRKVRLEHFVCAVLYAKDDNIGGKQVMKMEDHFKVFMEEVAWDFAKRYNNMSESWMEPYISEIRKNSEMFGEEFWASKLGKFVLKKSLKRPLET